MVEESTPRASGDTTSSASDHASAPATQSSAFQTALGAWRSIDLTTLQKSLDATANEIFTSQRDILVERKELAQKTKEWRKLDEEAKKEEWKGLLKSYQTFIDHLTTSKKSTETAFHSLYSALSEAPDPYPLLEATIDSLVNYSEMQSMTKDNASLQATVNRLTSQVANLEATIQKKNKELTQKDAELEEAAKKSEEVWRGVLDEKTRNWEGKEKALTEKLEHQEEVLKEMKASYEIAQKMGGSKAAQDDFIGKERAAELELVTRDLERTTLRLAEVEDRNEQLRLQLEKASNPEQQRVSHAPAEKEDESTILRLQQENASLLRRVDNAKAELDAQKKNWERKLRSVERTVEGLEADRDMLKTKVAKCADYDDLKRELEVLKSIEFATGDDEDSGDDMLDFSKPGATTTPTTSNKKETLEQLLLARNKKLGNELTVLRVSHQDLTTRLQTLQQTLTSTTADLTAARELNQKLENDLLRLQEASSPYPQHSSALSVAGTYVSRYPQPSHISRGRISPTSSIISGMSPVESRYNNDNQALPSPGILPMITAQRDRFKSRNAELESEIAAANSTISSLRSEIATLQKDNLALYEKTRYISSYTPSQSRMSANSHSSSSAYAPHNNNSSIERYRQAYESNISPFEAFRGRETARAYRRMSVPERAIYSLTRVILANRMSRNLFAGYCTALHVLVFCMLYWMGSAGAATGVEGMVAAGPKTQWEQVNVHDA